MEAPITVIPQPKPQKLQTVGILMLISGILNVIAGLGIVTGFALSVVLICCIPIAALPLALGVFEVIYGLRLVGSGQERVSRDTLQTVAILEVASILRIESHFLCCRRHQPRFAERYRGGSLFQKVAIPR